MKDGLVIGLIAAGGLGAAVLLMRNREAEQGGAQQAYYGGGGGAGEGYGGLESFTSIDPTTGLPINPYTGLPDPNLTNPNGQGAPAPVLDFRLSPEAEAALVRDAEDTNRRIAADNEATNQSLRNAADQQARDSELGRNVNIAVGAGLLAASYKGITSFGKSVITGSSGLGRNLPALARSAITSPAAPILGGVVQGGLSIGQGVQDLQARNRGEGPYARLSQPAAVTAATANTAAATAVGAGSLGLASFDFNKGVHFLGLPIATPGRKPGKSKLFGFWEI